MVVDYVFDVPLEDPTLAWRQVDEARKFVEFAPPALGETVEIEA